MPLTNALDKIMLLNQAFKSSRFKGLSSEALFCLVHWLKHNICFNFSVGIDVIICCSYNITYKKTAPVSTWSRTAGTAGAPVISINTCAEICRIRSGTWIKLAINANGYITGSTAIPADPAIP